MEIPKTDKALFLRIADGIRTAMRTGEYKPGEKLPATRTFAEQIGVHRHTLRAALDELVAEGWLKVEKRKGYMVNSEISLPEKKRGRPKKSPFEWQFNPQINLSNFSPKPGLVKFNFQSGLPDLRLFPIDEFKSCVNESLRYSKNELLDYSAPDGHPPLISALEEYTELMRGLKNRKIIITNGSQEAVYIAIRLLVKTGDEVAMATLSYPPARESFRVAGAKIKELAIDKDGVIPDSLEKAAKKGSLKLIFLTPTHQFPTTVNLSADRRLAIYNIAQKYMIPILEDDYDHEFHFSSEPPKPLAAYDSSGLVIYTSTFSKVLFPSSRLAFMAVSDEFHREFCQYRRIVSHQNDSILQDALARWYRNGGLLKHYRKMKKTYHDRCEVMNTCLKNAQINHPKLNWTVPAGGMAIWLDTGSDTDKLKNAALQRGVFVSPESDYTLKGKPGTHLRLGFSNLNESEIRQGIKQLFK